MDGIERELEDVRLVRISTSARQGIDIAQRFGVRGVPTMIVFDGAGNALLRQVGRLKKDGVLSLVDQLRE